MSGSNMWQRSRPKPMKAGCNMASFSQRLELRQSQRLTVTPQMRQAIGMLQLSNLELTDFIEDEIKQNPLLEWHGPSLGEGVSGEGGEVPAALPEMFTG